MKTEMYRIVFSNDAKKDLKELSKFRALQEVANLARNIIWPRITVMWGLFIHLVLIIYGVH